MTNPASIIDVLARIEIVAWGILAVGWVLTIGMTAAVASLKHRDPVDWALGALFLGPIILLIVSFVSVAYYEPETDRKLRRLIETLERKGGPNL